MVVGRELVALEELYCGLIQLEYDDLVEQVQTLDVLVMRYDPVGELCDARYLRLLTHKEGSD